jgi:hypothetical protein
MCPVCRVSASRANQSRVGDRPIEGALLKTSSTVPVEATRSMIAQIEDYAMSKTGGPSPRKLEVLSIPAYTVSHRPHLVLVNVHCEAWEAQVRAR